MALTVVTSTRVQFKYEAYDYEKGDNVVVNVSIPRVKRNADKDKVLELGNAIAEACGYDYGILATYFTQTDDIME